MFSKIAVAMLLMCNIAYAKVRIAVIDTGYSTIFNLCPDGHYDFTTYSKRVGYDYIGHGTKVAKAIMSEAGQDSCLMIYKIFDRDKKTSYERISEAIRYAVKNHADIINLSIEGDDFSDREFLALTEAVNAGVKVFVASGNKGKSLSTVCNVYPACYKLPIEVVGSYERILSEDGHVIAVTRGNYGLPITRTERWCYGNTCGTSFSSAFAAGKYAKILNTNKR